MDTGTLQELIDVCQTAFERLKIAIQDEQLEDLAITVHRSMSVEGRHFHTSEHVLGLVDPDNPIQTLAALFHDIVYYQVDRGFSSDIGDMVYPHILETENAVILSEAPSDEIFMDIAMVIFGFERGQVLPLNAGLNEFLSAVVLYKRLEEILPPEIILKLIVYIEATIPFRGPNPDGSSPFDTLETRLRQVCTRFNIPLSHDEIYDTIRGAVTFANKDVENFADPQAGIFLDNTWKLLPETNVALRSGEIYSIRDYRQALQKTYGFFTFLNPDHVFHAYRGTPSAEEHERLTRLAHRNVATGQEYMAIKLLTIAILEALANLTGGDAPLSLFMGEIEDAQGEKKRMEDFLPPVTVSNPELQTTIVYKLLSNGRHKEATFVDLKHSPLALFVYKRMGGKHVLQDIEYAKALFKGELPPQEFLHYVDPSLVADIAHACAAMVPTRSEKLLAFS